MKNVSFPIPNVVNLSELTFTSGSENVSLTEQSFCVCHPDNIEIIRDDEVCDLEVSFDCIISIIMPNIQHRKTSCSRYINVPKIIPLYFVHI